MRASASPRALVCSNCDHLKFYVGEKLIAEADPDRMQFAHLKYAPFSVDAHDVRVGWDDLRIDGYIQGKKVISRSFRAEGSTRNLPLCPMTRR